MAMGSRAFHGFSPRALAPFCRKLPWFLLAPRRCLPHPPLPQLRQLQTARGRSKHAGAAIVGFDKQEEEEEEEEEDHDVDGDLYKPRDANRQRSEQEVPLVARPTNPRAEDRELGLDVAIRPGPGATPARLHLGIRSDSDREMVKRDATAGSHEGKVEERILLKPVVAMTDGRQLNKVRPGPNLVTRCSSKQGAMQYDDGKETDVVESGLNFAKSDAKIEMHRAAWRDSDDVRAQPDTTEALNAVTSVLSVGKESAGMRNVATCHETKEFSNVHELADDISMVRTTESLKSLLHGRVLNLSTDTMLFLFSCLPMKYLGSELFSWMKNQPGFELDEDVFFAAFRNFVRAQKWRATEELYKESVERNVYLSTNTFSRMIKELTKARRFDLVETWFNRMKGNLQEATSPFNGLMLSYYKEKLYTRVFSVFDKMKAESVPQDLTSFCIMLASLRDAGETMKAVDFFKDMQNQGLPIDTKAYSIALDTLGKAGMVSEASSLFHQMQMQELQPDRVAYNSLIHAFAKAKMYKEADLVFQDSCKQSIKLDPIIFSTMIKMYADAGMPKQAHEILLSMKTFAVKAHEYAYHVVMNAYAKANYLDEVLEVYSDMRSSGCPVREVTYASMIKVYAKRKDEQAAEKMFQEMLESGFNRSVVAYCTIIDMYSKKGDIEKAMSTFSEMKKAGCRSNAWVYNILIDMFGKSDKLDDAFFYFEKMISSRISPDSVTYSSLIMAASKANDFEKAIRLFADLKRTGIILDKTLVATMINTFTKSGKYADLEILLNDAAKAGVEVDHRMYMSVYNAFLDANLHEKLEWLQERHGSLQSQKLSDANS